MEHGDRALRLAASIVGPANAHDVLQESFVDAWVNLGSLRRSDRFDPWFRMIVVNRCRSWLRAAKRQPVVRLDDPALGGPGADTPASSDFRPSVHQRVELEQAYAQLSADSKVILSMHYVADLTINQIATDLGLPVGTAKSRLNRALSEMRRAMGPR